MLLLPPLRPSARPHRAHPCCVLHSAAPWPSWLPTPRLRATDWCRSHWRRDRSSSCSLLYAAENPGSRIRPMPQMLRPPRGCRQARGSVVVVPSFSIHLLLCSAGFHRPPRYYEEIRLLHGRRPVVVASFGSTAHADPCRPPRVRCTGCPATPAPITATTSVGFWASRSKARSPGRNSLLRGSLSFGAAVRLGLLPHTTSRLQTGIMRSRSHAVTSDSRLLPTCPAKDFHLQSSAHAGHTFTPSAASVFSEGTGYRPSLWLKPVSD